ncbi:uncharacterized protein LAESUDRAFT_764291 [Laetiporus sulphureus 93-53]|uniref:Uncharacterized protein n=1 Tax=Laetiporus sulphureus 93-53 TaxID=1314785 RepID=A0A165BDX5_9APHY|nr:uncharacterized protein LAESUDRAFT_764291 [Laetiporus sulphureus 93-53]KZT00837.1 hypothetical protein LAESUDRAFT_764291 [Laetiporus sulphureus 93-53]
MVLDFYIGVLIVNDIFLEAINYFLDQVGSHNMVEDDNHEDKIHLEEQCMKKVKKSLLDQDMSNDMNWERESGNKDSNNDQEDIEMVQLPDQGEDMEVTQLLWNHVIEDIKASLSTERLEELRKEVFEDEELLDMSDDEDVEHAPSKFDNQNVEDAPSKSDNQDVEDAAAKFNN